MKKIYGSAIVFAQFLGAASIFAAENSPQTLTIICPFGPNGGIRDRIHTRIYSLGDDPTIRANTNASYSYLPYAPAPPAAFNWTLEGIAKDEMPNWLQQAKPYGDWDLSPSLIEMSSEGVVTCFYTYPYGGQGYFTGNINQDYTKNYDFPQELSPTECGSTSNTPCSITGTLKMPTTGPVNTLKIGPVKTSPTGTSKTPTAAPLKTPSTKTPAPLR